MIELLKTYEPERGVRSSNQLLLAVQGSNFVTRGDVPVL